MAYLKDHNILEVFQSGFKTQHSTESALLEMFNAILLATDAGDGVILVLLDLTAAFDTVDHEIFNFLSGVVGGHQGDSAPMVQVLFKMPDFLC